MTPGSRVRSLPAFRQPERSRWIFAVLCVAFLVDLASAIIDGMVVLIVADVVLLVPCASMAWALHREALKRR